MKRISKILALVLALTVVLTTGAFAVEPQNLTKAYVNETATTSVTIPTELAKKYKAVKTVGADKVTVAFDAAAPEKLTVTYKDAAISADGFYLVALLSASGDNYIFTENSIKYVDQPTDEKVADGQLTFDVYPASVTNGAIVIYGADGVTVVASVEAAYKLGDVNGDDKVNVRDAMAAAQFVAGKTVAGTFIEEAANVDKTAKINARDVMYIAQFAAKKITVFPIEQ